MKHSTHIQIRLAMILLCFRVYFILFLNPLIRLMDMNQIVYLKIIFHQVIPYLQHHVEYGINTTAFQNVTTVVFTRMYSYVTGSMNTQASLLRLEWFAKSSHLNSTETPQGYLKLIIKCSQQYLSYLVA